ncbi:MAG: cobalt ECF transporter T component CbiQ [Planctomycetes bacterium]|nr:cobalt ECF transporter T component CbiQ [Planctomycetota bacterium]
MHPEIDRFAHLDSWLHRLDPRWKLAAALVLVIAITLDRPSIRTDPRASRDLSAAAACLALSVGLLLGSSIPVGYALRKLAPAAGFLLLMVVFFPLVYESDTIRIGFLRISLTGLLVAAVILIKALAILLLVVVALGTTRFDRTMKALHRLRVPEPLVQIAMFAYRYLFVVFDQNRRMRQAMRARGFRPRTGLRSLRALSRGVGSLVVGSLERTRRIRDAMVARGYRGEYPSLAVFRTTPADVAALAGAVILSTVLLLWRFL